MKNCTKRKSYRTLFRAVERKDLDKIKKELPGYRRSSLREESLLFAGHFAGLETVEFLLKNGVNANEQDDMGDTVLNYAAAENNVAEVELLLKYGALPDIPNVHGEDAFSFACTWGALEAAVCLYNHGSRMTWVKNNWTIRVCDENSNLTKEIKDFLRSINIFTQDSVPHMG